MCVQVEGCGMQVSEGVRKEETGEGIEDLEKPPLKEDGCHGKNQEPAKGLVRPDKMAE